LYDNTRISSYKDCPRAYYFRHVMHWRPAGLEWPLVFGASWHAAMDYVWTKMVEPYEGPNSRGAPFKAWEPELIARGAYKKFVEHWIKEGAPPPEQIDYEMAQELSPRTPQHAFEMLAGYVLAKRNALREVELVATEKPFAVPLDPQDPNLFYIGKIDKQVRVKHTGKIRGIEHKTTTAYKKNGPFRGGYIDSFSPNSQVEGYTYALHIMHPGNVAGVWVDAALVHKTEEGFMFIPVEKQLKMLDAWLWETRRWIRRIEEDEKMLISVHSGDEIMQAYPKNTNSCWNFNRACPYMDCCRAWPNPVGKPMPPEMIESKWDPLQHLGPIEGITDGPTQEEPRHTQPISSD